MTRRNDAAGWLAGAVLLLCLLVCSAVMGVMAARVAHGHEAPSGWQYPSDCCDPDGQECDPIPEHAVQSVKGGYLVTLRPGDHKYVTREVRFMVAANKVRASGDGGIHACISPTQCCLWCLILPLVG